MFSLTGLYRGIWRYASLPDLFNIARAVSLTVLIFLPVMFVLTRLEALPRSTLLINWFVLIALLGAPRLAYRLFKDRGLDHVLERAKHQNVPVLLISAKDGADTFIREMMRDPRAVYRVVGVLADTPSRVGREICRVPVLGTIDSLEAVVEQLDRRGKRPQKLIITAQNLSGDQVRSLLDRAEALAIPLARLPRLTDFQRNLDDPEHALEPIALEDLAGSAAGGARPRQHGAADPRAPRAGHRRRRHDRRRTGPPDRRLFPGRLIACSITASSRFTRSTWNCASGFRSARAGPVVARRARPRAKSTQSSPPSAPRSCFTRRR